MSDNRTTKLVSCREAATLITEFLCEYQDILLSHRLDANADEVVRKQNELIDEYAERIVQTRVATLGGELNPDGLPIGLFISEDGELLNWRGENYVKQSTLGECEIVTTEGWLPVERYHRCKICGAFFAVNACPNCGRW